MDTFKKIASYFEAAAGCRSSTTAAADLPRQDIIRVEVKVSEAKKIKKRKACLTNISSKTVIDKKAARFAVKVAFVVAIFISAFFHDPQTSMAGARHLQGTTEGRSAHQGADRLGKNVARKPTSSLAIARHGGKGFGNATAEDEETSDEDKHSEHVSLVTTSDARDASQADTEEEGRSSDAKKKDTGTSGAMSNFFSEVSAAVRWVCQSIKDVSCTVFTAVGLQRALPIVAPPVQLACHSIREVSYTISKAIGLQHVQVPHLEGHWGIAWSRVPPTWMPDMADMDTEESKARKAFWPVFLLGVVVLGAGFSEAVRVLIITCRVIAKKHGSYTAVQQDAAQRNDEQNVNVKLGMLLHVLNECVCTILAVFAFKEGLVAFGAGVAWEVILIWVLWTHTDFLIQTMAWATTCELVDQEIFPNLTKKIVAPTIVLGFVPAISDKVDIFLDNMLVPISFTCGVVGQVCGILGIGILIYSTYVLYSTTEGREDVADEFCTILAKLDEGAVGLMTAARDPCGEGRKYLLQQIAKAVTPHRMKVEKTENVPQVALKGFLMTFSGCGGFTGFVGFTVVVGLLRPLALLLAAIGTSSWSQLALTRDMLLKRLRHRSPLVRGMACEALGKVVEA